jgi:moderate conductance mechanosensitive channel
VVVWEGANAVIDRRLELLGRSGRATRLRTLLPLLRTALLVTIAIVIGLTALSELGVDIAPLLAGAGIVGVAIGFGSQALGGCTTSGGHKSSFTIWASTMIRSTA